MQMRKMQAGESLGKHGKCPNKQKWDQKGMSWYIDRNSNTRLEVRRRSVRMASCGGAICGQRANRSDT
jgi:hypothetical protein